MFLRERDVHPLLRRVPVAVVTAAPTAELVASRVEAVVPKPADVEPLLDLVGRKSVGDAASQRWA